MCQESSRSSKGTSETAACCKEQGAKPGLLLCAQEWYKSSQGAIGREISHLGIQRMKRENCIGRATALLLYAVQQMTKYITTAGKDEKSKFKRPARAA